MNDCPRQNPAYRPAPFFAFAAAKAMKPLFRFEGGFSASGGARLAPCGRRFEISFNFKCAVNFKSVSPRASRLQATYFSQSPEK